MTLPPCSEGCQIVFSTCSHQITWAPSLCTHWSMALQKLNDDDLTSEALGGLGIGWKKIFEKILLSKRVLRHLWGENWGERALGVPNNLKHLFRITPAKALSYCQIIWGGYRVYPVELSIDKIKFQQISQIRLGRNTSTLISLAGITSISCWEPKIIICDFRWFLVWSFCVVFVLWESSGLTLLCMHIQTVFTANGADSVSAPYAEC